MKSTWNTLSHNGKADPGTNLIGVIRTRNNAEQTSQRISSRHRDFTDFTSSRSQASKSPMNTKIAQFAEQKSSQSSINLSVRGSGVQRMIHMVRHISCKSPVIWAILEQIPDGHSSVGKSMHKKRLQDPLSIVTGPAQSGDLYHGFVNDFAEIPIK